MYGVAAFGPDASDVGVLSAGEMSISWLGRSTQNHLKVNRNNNNYVVRDQIP